MKSLKTKTKDELITEIQSLKKELQRLNKASSGLEKAKNMIKKSEQEFRILSEASPVGIYKTDNNGNCTYANLKWLEMAGLTLEQALGKGWIGALHPDDKKEISSKWHKSVQSSGKWGYEYRFQNRKGEVSWIYGTAKKITDESGQNIGYIGINIDITEKKNAQQELLNSEERYRKLFETESDAVLIFDAESRQILDVNRAARHLYGYTKKEFLKLKHDQITTELKESNLSIHTTLKQKQLFIPLRYHRKKDGTVFPVEISGSTFQLKGRQVICKIIKDISQRQQADFEKNILQRLARRLTNPLSLKETGKVLAEEAFALFEYDSFSLDLLDESEKLVHGIYSEDTPVGHTKPKEMLTHSNPLKLRKTKSVLYGHPRLINRRKEPSKTDFTSFGDTNRLSMSLMFVPIRFENRPIGIITVQNYTKNKYKKKDLSLFQSFSDHTGGALVRSKLENALKESESNFRTYFDTAVVGFYRTTPDGKIIWANQTLIDMLGFDSFNELSRRNLEKSGFNPQYSGAEFKQRLENEGEIRNMESAWFKRDGSVIYVSENTKVHRDSEGNIKYYDGSVEDITDRFLAEENLKESENLYRELVEKANIAFIHDDKEGNFTFYNQRFADIFGYNYDEIQNKKIPDLVHPDELEKVMKLHQQRLNGEKVTQRYEFKAKRKDGQEIYLEIDTEVLRDNGKITGTRSYIWDITQRKFEQQALQENEEKLRNIFENSSNLFYSHTPDHQLTYLSPQVKDILGYTPEEARIKWTQFTSDNPINKTGMEYTIKAIKSGQAQPPYELELIHKSGKKIMVEVREAPVVKNGKTVAIVGALVDISDRKQAEAALLESETKFREMANLLPQIIYETDLSGKLTYVNNQAFTIYGYSKKDFEKGLNAFQMLIPEDRERAKLNAQKVLNGELIRGAEYTALKKDGGHVPVIVFSVPIYKDNQPVGLRGVIVDITEQKAVEKALRKSEERLIQIAENAKEWIWEVDPDGLYTYSSPMVKEIIGYDVDEVVGKKYFYDFFHPDDKEEIKRLSFRYFDKKRNIKNLVNRCLTKDGSTVWLSTSGVPILDNKGNLTGYRGADTNVTENIIAKQKLIHSEERMKIIFEYAPDAYYLNDLKGNFVDGNKAAQDLLGYKKEELIGKNFFGLNILSKRDIPKALKNLAKNVMGKGTGPDEFTLIRKDGKQIEVEIRSYPVKIKDETVVLGIARDISDRKKSEKLLKQTHEIYRQSIENAQGVPYLLRFPERKYEFVGTGCEQLLGISHARLTFDKLKKMIQQVIITDENAPDDLQEYGRQYVEGKVNQYRYDLKIKTPQGNMKWLSDCSVPLIENGKVIGSYGILQDITQRKNIENQLRQRTRELSERIKELNFLYSVTSLISQSEHSIDDILQKIVDLIPGSM